MYNFDEIIDRRNTQCVKWDCIKEDLLPMWVADMDLKCPPEVINALKNRVDQGILGYPGGCHSYYDSVISWMKGRFNWNIKREWICPSPGIVPAINILIRSLTKPGDKIIVQSPVYFPFFSAIKNNGCIVVDNTLKYYGERYTMDFERLEKQFDSDVKLMILCSPHNPVGRVWNEDELRRLGELCIKHNVIVISDEIHCDLIFKENKHRIFASLSEEFAQNCVICNAPSKTFNIAGLQASNIIIPNDKIRAAFHNGLESIGIEGLNVLAISALEACYMHGEPWLEELLTYLKGNYDFLKEYVKDKIPEIKVTESQGTYLAWLDCRELGLDDKELENFTINEAKLYLNQGHIFGNSGSGFLRMNIGCPREILKDGLQRLENAVKGLRTSL